MKAGSGPGCKKVHSRSHGAPRRRGGVRIHELIGERDVPADLVGAYESAFALYQGRGFADAARALDGLHQDGPSACLRDRCRRLAASPPPAEWDGVHAWDVK
jgi:adenylate cyclase